MLFTFRGFRLRIAGLFAVILSLIAAASVQAESAERTFGPVEVLVRQFTVAEFCGRANAVVQNSYGLKRAQLAGLTADGHRRLRDFRITAIREIEDYLFAAGPREYNAWCNAHSDRATNFILNAQLSLTETDTSAAARN